MKKYFAITAMAALALVSCNKNGFQTDDKNQDGNGNTVTGIVLNELDATNKFIELCDASGKVLDSFVRGEEGSGWNQVSGYENDKKHSFSRCPDGTGEWAYADPTRGAANGEKAAEISHENI